MTVISYFSVNSKEGITDAPDNGANNGPNGRRRGTLAVVCVLLEVLAGEVRGNYNPNTLVSPVEI